jgi:imidazolonepropionase-like amidohydrolase
VADHGHSGTSLLITNARVLDGTGAAPTRDLKSIRVVDGCIAEIFDAPTGDETAARNASMQDPCVLDTAGATVMPGLIDGYVLLQNSPGSVYRGDDEETRDRLRAHHLRAYLACGVTTVMNAEISAAELRILRDHLAAGGVGPRVLAAAPTFTPPGGYLDNEVGNDFGNAPLEGGVASRADVEARFAAFEGLEEHLVGVTVLMEPGNGGIRIWPVHTPEMRRIIAEEAAKRDLPVFFQTSNPKEFQAALEMGARGSLMMALSKRLANTMRERGVYQGTTAAGSFESMLIARQPERLDDDLVRLVVPTEVLATAADPVAWKTILTNLYATVAPRWWPSAWTRAVSRVLYGDQGMSVVVSIMMQAALKAHRVGVATAVGSKGGCLPPFLGAFHGVSTIREIELLGEAGMAPMDVLCSATRIPAEMMRIDHLVGTVEVGKRADLIVVGEDPLEDLSALRQSLKWTIRDGDARTPAEWMR